MRGGGGLVTETNGGSAASFSFEDVILDPLPPQSRNTPYGRALLSLASFAGRALSATGLMLLIITGASNLGATLLALLLNRAAPGKALLAFLILGVSWAFWLALGFLRWRLNKAGPGETVGENWGLVQGEDAGFTSPPPTSPGQAFNQRATREGDASPLPTSPGHDTEGSPAGGSARSTYSRPPGSEPKPNSMSRGGRADGTVSVEAAERNARAQAEFSTRRSTPFPRVEAAQRSIRVLVGGPEQPAWVRFDLRPLVVTFVGVAVSFPVVIVTATITMVALLVATAPF